MVPGPPRQPSAAAAPFPGTRTAPLPWDTGGGEKGGPIWLTQWGGTSTPTPGPTALNVHGMLHLAHSKPVGGGGGPPLRGGGGYSNPETQEKNIVKEFGQIYWMAIDDWDQR